MKIPPGFDPRNPECPKCHKGMWDNRQKKNNPKAPDFRCKDRGNCDGAIWGTPGEFKALEGASPATAAPAAAQRQVGAWQPGGYKGRPLTTDDWIATTAHVLGCIRTSIDVLYLDGQIKPSEDVMLAEARALTSQYWISVERNIVFPDGYEPQAAAPPSPPEKAAAKYRKQLDAANDIRDLAKISMHIGAASDLDAQEKEELSEYAMQRTRTVVKQQDEIVTEEF